MTATDREPPMYDPPPGMQARVERLLQVIAVLRAADLPVRRATLVARVDEYRQDDHSACAMTPGKEQDKAFEALRKKLNGDLHHLRELGFSVTDTAGEGLESTWVLKPTPWRLPVALDEQEQTALTWLLGASAATEVAEGTVLPPLPAAALLGTLPSALDLAHAALAGRRRLVIERRGEEKVVEPVQMSVRSGRWYLLVRYGPDSGVYGYRLDRLRVLRLGEVMTTAPQPVDERLVLDPTAWRVHEPLDADIRCDPDDAQAVRSWFPRAELVDDGAEVSLTFSATNVDAVVDRVIGLAGAARLVAPVQAVEALRARLVDALAVTA